MRFSTRLPVVAVTLAALATACSEATAPALPTVVDGPRPGLVVVNDAATLASRLTDRGARPVALEVPAANGMLSLTADAPIKFELTADVGVPQVGKEPLAATHVAVSGTFAYVAYATPGESYGGAVDVFDVSVPESPVLVSSAQFEDTDVHALAVSGSTLWLATATASPAFAEPAVLEAITLKGGQLTDESRRVGLPSFAALGVVAQGTNVWVVSGNGGPNTGGVSVFDQVSLKPVWFDRVDDARAVGLNGSVVTVVQGTPGRVRLYTTGTTPTFLRSFPVGGLSQRDGKAHIANSGNWGVVATGEGGPVFTRIRQNGVTTGTTLFTVSKPALPDLDGAYTVTNGVAMSGDVLYSANGGAGVWVATGNWSRTAQNLVPTVTSVGRLALDGVSSNLVATANGTLLVATGQGLKLLRFTLPTA
jgi:hypothetical protein